MKKIRIICFLLCVLLIFGAVPFTSAASDDGVKSEIPYADVRDAATSPYWYKSMKIYTEQEAVEAGVPEGSSGYVMKLVDDSAIGITVDFSAKRIPLTIVKAIRFRVYYGEHTKEVRATADSGVSWVLRYTANKPGQWNDIVLSDAAGLKALANGDGFLGVFGFGFRSLDDGSKNNVAYIDEIRAELIDDDGVPPVIRYNGPEHINVSEGIKLQLDAVAWDELENAEFPIEYVWDKEATDGEGRLVKGEYRLTLRAKDSFGNTAEKELTVTVGDRDVKAPVIDCGIKSITTVAGAYVRLDFKATDDRDDVKVVQTWSDGATDKTGRINEGSHTLTLTSSDLSGNTATVTVSVTAKKTLD